MTEVLSAPELGRRDTARRAGSLVGIDRETGHFVPLGAAERRAAIAWGAARTWFLGAGATQGNHAACLAVAMDGRRVAVQRSSHASTFNGIALAGLAPTALMPEVDDALGIAHGVDPAALDAELRAAPEIRAVFVVSPTPFGVCADVGGLAEVCHRHGAALIVDEAWGAHLRFGTDLPADALALGADLVVSGTHHGLGSTEGTAMLHRSHDAPDWLSADRIRRALDVLASPRVSADALASLDAARARAEAEGAALLGTAVRELTELRAEVRAIPGLDVIDERQAGRPGFAAFDPMRLTIDVRGTGRTGYELAAAVEGHPGVSLDLVQERVVAVAFALVDAPRALAQPLVEALDRLSTGWARTASRLRVVADPPVAREPDGNVRQARPAPRFGLTPREALLAPGVMVPVEEAAGRIAAEALVPYPPGIPAVLPGEVLEVDRLLALRDAVHLGANLRGASDPLVGAVRVVGT